MSEEKQPKEPQRESWQLQPIERIESLETRMAAVEERLDSVMPRKSDGGGSGSGGKK